MSKLDSYSDYLRQLKVRNLSQHKHMMPPLASAPPSSDITTGGVFIRGGSDKIKRWINESERRSARAGAILRPELIRRQKEIENEIREDSLLA